MSTPAVSVVMPVYNGARFVRAAIDSVLGQTFRDFELVVVDDGSTDDTPLLVEAAARADGRVRPVPHPRNRGVVAARNTAVAAARAPLVAVLDSDDLAVPDRLARQVAYLADHPEVSILGGAVQLIDDRDRLGEIRRYPLQPGLAAWSMLFFNSVAHSTMMMRRELFAAGYPAGAAEDYAMLAPLSLTARIANLPDVLARYRAWPGSFTVQGWQRQEGHANEIVQRLVADVIGETIPLSMAELLRGLSRNRYPRDPVEIKAAAGLIRRLAETVHYAGRARP